MKRTYYYARVSSSSQNLARQIAAFKDDGADDHDIITEKASGKSMDRPEYQALKDHMLRSGDTLVVMSLDRLGRNKKQIKDELEWCNKHHIRVRILNLPALDAFDKKADEDEDNESDAIKEMVRNIIIEVLATQAEQERKTIKKRQAEGIAEAKKAGKYKGGSPKKIDEFKFKELYKRYCLHEISKSRMADELGISRPTLYRLFERKGLK